MRIRARRALAGILFSGCVSSAVSQVPTVNGANADRGTAHLFIDETQGDSAPLSVLFTPNQPDITNAEVFPNLNHRRRVQRLQCDRGQ